MDETTCHTKCDGEDDIASIIDDFCCDLALNAVAGTEASFDAQMFAFKRFLHAHWAIILSSLETNESSQNTQSHAYFYQLGLPIKWFHDAQKFILNRLCDTHKKKQVRWGRRQDQKIHALMNCVMDDLFYFYTFSSTSMSQIIKDENLKTSQFLQHTIVSVLKGVVESARDLVNVTRDVSKMAHQIDKQAESMNTLARFFSENLSKASLTTQRLSGAIEHISERIMNGVMVTQKSALEADKAQEVVQSLSHAANKIGEVVKIINEIANQTNLLALNATIEAARAGHAGKGFSVVASEVKSLAGQTAKATEEITKQIKAMQDETNHVVVSIHEMSVTIRRINEGTIEISSAVNEQGKMAQDTLENIERIREASLTFTQLIYQLNDLLRTADDRVQQTHVFSTHIADRSHYLTETLTQMMHVMHKTPIRD